MVKILTTPSADCPVCGIIMPQHFNVCRACWRDVPFSLKAEYWTSTGVAHIYKTPANQERERQSHAAILSHLRQHSTAIL